MQWEEYLELSEKTLSTEFHIKEDEKLQRVLHGIIGLATEIEELLDNYTTSMDEINMLEELGDLTWYLAIIHREYPKGKRTIIRQEPLDAFNCVIMLNKNVLKLLDMMKKKIYYNKDINVQIFDDLVLLVEDDIHWLANHYGLKVEDICQVNIDKLKARYGEKFSSERAINRDLDTERNILEGK